MTTQQQDDPYAGQYAGSAIVFPRRTSAAQPGQPTRKRYARQPEADHLQGHTFGIHPADDNYSSDSFDVEGADYPDEPPRSRSSAVRYPVPSRHETVHLQPKPTKVIALNLHGVIEVIQINPQDHTKDAVYVLTDVGNESVPTSLSFRDVNGDGKVDMLVMIGDSTPYTIIMLNTGKTFQPVQATH